MHLVQTGPQLKKNLRFFSAGCSTVAAWDPVKWRKSGEQVQGQASGDGQLVFHPVHQNVLRCQRCNGATVIAPDKLQRCCSSLPRSVSFSEAAAETLCFDAKPPQSGCGIVQEEESLSSTGAKSLSRLGKGLD